MKSRKIATWLLSILCLGALSLGVACGDNSVQNESGVFNGENTQSSVDGGQEQLTEIEQVYAQYVMYVSEKNQTPLSYEEWLASIKGEKGDKGDQGLQGEKGDKGDQGEAGVGIEKVEFDNKGNFLVTFTDGTTQTVPMPKVEGGGEETVQEGTSGLHYMRIPGKDEYRVVSLGMADDTDIVIASTYKGLPVTEIGDEAFYKGGADTNLWKHLISSITLPDTITHIGENAFYKCEYLTELVFPDSVTSIGYGAFDGCDGLTEVVIPNSVTSIGDYAFAYCDNLTEVVIGDSVTSIGSNTFYHTNRLEKIVCPTTALAAIPTTVTRVILTSGKSISNHAFEYCVYLTEVIIPNSVTSIGSYAFYGCSSLTEVVIPNSVTSIGESAFENCFALKQIVISQSVEEVARYAFRGCSSLTIYCEVESKPDSWNRYWNESCHVVWGYKGE